MKYAMIHKFRAQHPITRLCALVDVAKSGYQAWCAGKVTSPRKLEDMLLVVAIKAAHQRGRGIYGPEKIQSELLAQGMKAGLNRIKRLRRLHSVRCTHKKKFKVTTDSKHSLPIAANILDRQFTQTAPNHVWVADITYIPTDEGWLFLAAVKDLYTCEIVGWAMDKQMTKTLVLDALRAAYWRKKPKPGLLHHSDRGSQYCSGTYRALQVSYKMKTSMSRKGDCWERAACPRGTMPLWNVSLAHSKPNACIISNLKPVIRQGKLCSIISRCSTTVFGGMPRFKTRCLPITQINSIKMNYQLRHN